MKRLLLLFILIIASAMAFADEDPGYYFTNYEVEMTVTKENKYLITEHIDAVFTVSSRGIFRMIPTYVWVKRDVSEAQDGSKTRMMHYKVDIDDMNVSENWAEVEEAGDSLYGIRIGSASVWIEGPHSYTISYTLQPYDDRIEQSDLFFYSVLGSGWDCNIRHFSFKVNFDEPISQEEMSKLQVFAGPEGQNYDYSDEILTDITEKSISGKVDNIMPRNAVTVYLPLHEGYFERSMHPMLDIIVSWIFFALGIILISYVLYKELFHNQAIVKVISFYPPKGCSSADIGTLIDCSVDECDIISLIPYFAEKGYLTIDNSGTYPILKKVMPIPDSAPDYQKTLFNGFFMNGDSFNLKSVPTEFGNIWMKCERQLNKKFEGKLDYLDESAITKLCFAILAVSAGNCFAANSNDGWVVGAVTTFLFGVATFVQIFMSTGESSTIKKGGFWNAILGCISIVLLGSQMGILLVEFIEPADPSYLPVDAIYGINILLGIACLLANNLNNMTEYRKNRLGEILGLHEFISTADKPQLEHLQAEDEQYFYKVLPYAVAFGMAETWAKKFAGINIPTVKWYKGTGNNDYMNMSNLLTRSKMTRAFASSVDAAERAAAAAAAKAAARSSSGSSYHSSSSYSSGGGGYSGGGFGGGGGGRW